MRRVALGIVSAVLVAAASFAVAETQRAQLLQLTWGHAIPEAKAGDPATKPLLVYVTSGLDTRDQDRFDEVVLANESLLLAAKFFTCVEVSESEAREHPLFAKIKVKPPSMVAFDSTREKHSVAGGRASGMKVYTMLCKVGQVDYETSISGTVRAARNLLGSFDRIDAAVDALGIKQKRLDDALSKNDSAKIRKLEKEVAKDQAAIDELSETTTTRWAEIWDLKRKVRDDPPKKNAGKGDAERKPDPQKKNDADQTDGGKEKAKD